MSFSLELAIPNLNHALAQRLEDATDSEDTLRVVTSRGGPPWNRRWEALLEDRRGDVPVLSDDADWEQPAFSLDDRGSELLASTIEAVARIAPEAWTLRAAWEGDRVVDKRDVTAAELADLARCSALARSTRYRVVGSRT